MRKTLFVMVSTVLSLQPFTLYVTIKKKTFDDKTSSTVFAMFHFPANSDASSNMFIAEAKSWRQAQSHCRSLSSDLVSIHSAEENAADSLLSRSQTVWIGLFGDPWKWSSGSNSSFRLWKPNQPNYVNSQQCVVTELKDGGKWNNRNCNAKFSFICQKGKYAGPSCRLL